MLAAGHISGNTSVKNHAFPPPSLSFSDLSPHLSRQSWELFLGQPSDFHTSLPALFPSFQACLSQVDCRQLRVPRVQALTPSSPAASFSGPLKGTAMGGSLQLIQHACSGSWCQALIGRHSVSPILLCLSLYLSGTLQAGACWLRRLLHFGTENTRWELL